MVNSLNDGLSKPDQIAADAITDVEKAFGHQITGSPSVPGLITQTGSITSTAGSVANITFGTEFLGVPKVQVQQLGTAGAVLITTGSLSTTGFTCHSAGSSKLLHYIAVGSGTFNK